MRILSTKVTDQHTVVVSSADLFLDFRMSLLEGVDLEDVVVVVVVTGSTVLLPVLFFG